MIRISEQCAGKLPRGRILCNCVEKDMDGTDRDAVKILYVDDQRLARLSYFDSQTGEYIGDGFV